MNELFLTLVLAALVLAAPAALVLYTLLTPTKKWKDNDYRYPYGRRYAGNPGEGVYGGTYYGGGIDSGFGGDCGGFGGDCGGFGGGDCGGGF